MTPYSGTFGKPELLHLLRRTLFGVKKSDLAYFANRTLSSVVTELLTVSNTPPAPPLKNYNEPTTVTSANPDSAIPLGSTWVDSTPDANVRFSRFQSVRSWWMGLLVHQDRNIREKMVLFLHNLVPTEIDGEVKEPIYCYRYNALLRQYALGNYKTFIRQMTIEPAMLNYLDGELNTRTAPNENYGRELQELFTVGKDVLPHYTEDDVRAAAKVLSGWQIDNATLSSKFTLSRHETANKIFSAFYNNTIITGRNSATAGLEELDDLLNMIFTKVEVSKYIMRKLYRFFVYYNIDATIETEVIEPLAETFRNNNYALAPVLQALFTSQHFFENLKARGCMIKNPTDYIVGLFRQFGMKYTNTPDLATIYRDWITFVDLGNLQEMKIGNPPSVAGWAAYHQAPNYHELWINAETLRRKKDFAKRYIDGTGGTFGLAFDIFGFTAALDNPSDPNLMIDEVIELFHVMPMDAAIKTQLKSILLSNQTEDSYWTITWNNYFADPTNTTNFNIVRTRLRTFYQTIVDMAEYHLS